MKKCVILTGAGAASLWKVNGEDYISTSSITKALCDKDDFFSNLSSYLSSKFTNGSQVNFETILHAIEVLFQYYRGGMRPFDNIQTALFKVEEEITEIIKRSNPIDASIAMNDRYREAINFIREEIFRYDDIIKVNSQSTCNNQIMLFLNLVHKHDCIIRAYTTNYDQMFIDCCPEDIHLFDGTVPVINSPSIKFSQDIHQFDIQKINSFSDHCYYNLHGSIYWNWQHERFDSGKNSTFYLENDYCKNIEYELNESNPNEPILLSPIITGYNKVQRIHFEPFLAFSNSFYRDCSDGDYFIFIGFSFADPYLTNVILNSEIKKKKVLIIDNSESQLIKYLGFGDTIDNNGLFIYTPEFWQFQKPFQKFLCCAEDILNDFFK